MSQEQTLVSGTSMDLPLQLDEAGVGVGSGVGGRSPQASRRVSGIFTPPGTPRRGTQAGDATGQVQHRQSRSMFRVVVDGRQTGGGGEQPSFH